MVAGAIIAAVDVLYVRAMSPDEGTSRR